MKLGKTTTFVVLGELEGFQVGEEINKSMIVLKDVLVENSFNVSEAIRKVEFRKEKSYPISKITQDIKGVNHSSDLFETPQGKAYPIFVVCIDLETNSLKFMYNDKRQLSYSNYFRKLDKTINKWYIGYLKEEELASFPSGDIIEEDSGHIVDIIKQIERLELNFRKTPKTIYDVANLVKQGEISLTELTQEKLNTL